MDNAEISKRYNDYGVIEEFKPNGPSREENSNREEGVVERAEREKDKVENGTRKTRGGRGMFGASRIRHYLTR